LLYSVNCIRSYFSVCMKQSEINRVVYITVGLTLTGIFILILARIDILTWAGIKTVASFFSTIILLWGLYFSFGWKLPVLRHILYKENLNGTWYGTYYSKKISTGEEYRGDIALVIRQSFLAINIKSFTTHYRNFSFGEALNYNKASDHHQLIYLYSQSKLNPTDDNIRKGTSELELISEGNNKKLVGDFWTNHDSKGYLDLNRISKIHFQSFTDTLTYYKNAK